MKNQQIFSTVTKAGVLELSLENNDIPTPTGDQVLVKLEACPINPSDMFPLFGLAAMEKAKLNGTILTAPIPPERLGMMAARMGMKLPVGNEGAGRVVATGDAPEAKALDGRLVALLSGETYANYACVPASACLPHNADTKARDAASSFVNPLTAFAMIETMHRDKHSALVHTAAASNLGQMLVKLCQAENVPLVNIVRKPEQAALLRDLGASHICDSSAADFPETLMQAIDETGANLAFDAIGGGQMAGHILAAMERVASKNATGLNSYGSTQHKQVYLYGSLDFAPTTIQRNFGMFWGIGGWLMRPILAELKPERRNEIFTRVADEITTTFASSYTAEISLQGLLDPANIAGYLPRKTGTKYLVTPNKDA